MAMQCTLFTIFIFVTFVVLMQARFRLVSRRAAGRVSTADSSDINCTRAPLLNMSARFFSFFAINACLLYDRFFCEDSGRSLRDLSTTQFHHRNERASNSHNSFMARKERGDGHHCTVPALFLPVNNSRSDYLHGGGTSPLSPSRGQFPLTMKL